MGPDSRLETPVPREQRPVNQLKELKESPLLTWVRLGCNLHPCRAFAVPGVHGIRWLYCSHNKLPLPPCTLYNQATLDGRAYQQRFLLLYASLLGLLAAPIAAQTFDPGVQVGLG